MQSTGKSRIKLRNNFTEEIGYLSMEQSGLYQSLRILEVREEAVDFKTIIFDEGHNISYRAGQYLTLVRFDGAEERRRSYSITSSPVLNEPLAIGVKRVENGAFSRELVDRAKPGDELLTTGSGGFFVLPDEEQAPQHVFFFAAGSGITPVFSLLKTLLHTRPNWSAVLIYSNTSEEKAIFLSSLQQLQWQFSSRFHLKLLFSNSADLAKARLHRDLIFSFLNEYGAQSRKSIFYICGPESYMRLCTYTLQEAGVSSSAIRRENFYFNAIVKRDAIPPDRLSYTATIRLQNNEYKLPVHYPDSILRAAKKAGLALPYSCEAGRCGNCAAHCIKGRVWHSYNEVLTDNDLAKGLVLTCVGHPVGGDVTLVF